MNESENILEGYSPQEKFAYLGAIASLATADRTATQEEVDHITALAQAAELSDDQQKEIINAATGTSGVELKQYLDVLQNSKSKFSLIADIITFAKVDNRYTEDERKSIKQIASYLQVDENQFSLLDQFVDKATQQNSGEEVRKPGFLESLGLKNKFESAGINSGSFVNGLLGMLGPLLLGRMLGGRGRSGGVFGQGRSPIPSGSGFGGLGSIISMLNGNRASGGIGSILSRILK